MLRLALPLTGCALVVALVLPAAGAQAAAATGQPDPRFGTGGTTALTPTVGDLEGTMLAHQAGATVVAASRWTYDPATGSADAVLALQRLDRTGHVDPAFGDAGVQLVRFAPGPAALRGLVVMADHTIVVLASTGTGASEEQQVALARLSADGHLDPSFGTGGITVSDLRAQHLSPVALLPLDDGGVLVGLDQDSATSDFAVARYGRAGRLVPTYGLGGIATVDLGASDHLAAITAARDGRIIAVGSSAAADHQSIAVARLTPTGILDRSYGKAGRVQFRPGGPYALAGSVTRVGEGVLIAGGVNDASGQASFLARLDAHGRLLPGFGLKGVLRLDAPGVPDSAGLPVVMSDGTVAFARMVGDGPFAGLLQRVQSDTGAPVASFGSGGTVDLGASRVEDLLADGPGLLTSSTVFADDGPHEVVQRRR